MFPHQQLNSMNGPTTGILAYDRELHMKEVEELQIVMSSTEFLSESLRHLVL
jgi:hypothetical protein